ncbi:MAG: aminomethyltransferase beta-barrel domain-containing protein [Candidatus Margulisiibacteriota bacterium]
MQGKNLNWIYQDLPQKFTCKVVTRYHAKEIVCQVEQKPHYTLTMLSEPHYDISPGQSAVFYDGEYVIGGGEIIF